jgi:PAS domain S-box-containing protein
LGQIHSLLKRQLKRQFGEEFQVPEAWQGFIDAVNNAYREFDIDRRMLERSLELSSQELLQTNSELRAVFQAIPDLLFRLDSGGTILDYKASLTSDFLVQPKELLGRRIQDIPFKSVGRKFREAIRQVQETGSMATIEYSLTLQGQEYFYEARLLPLPEGQLIAIVRNITDRKETEVRLREINRTLQEERQIFIGGPAVIFKWKNAPRWPVEYVSTNVEDVFGYAPEEFLSGKVLYSDVIREEDRERVTNEVSAFAAGSVTSFTHTPYQIVRKDGDIIWLADYTTVLRNEAGEATHYLGYVLNITRHKQADDALRMAHQRLFDIIEFLPDATFVIDRERKVIAWNKAIEAMTGIRKEDMLGKGDYAYAVPLYGKPRPILIDLIFERAESSKNRYDLITMEGDTISAEVYVPKTYKGKGAYLSATASPLVDAEGRIMGAIESIRDVTEHKRVERELQESEGRYRIAIESSNDGIAIMKGDIHLYVNRRFVELFGYDDPREIIGKSNRETVHPDDFNLVNDINTRRQRGESVPDRYEFKGIKKDGTPVYIEVSATNTVYKGTPVSLVYLRDITERKRAEEELREAEKKYRAIFENAREGIFQTTPEGRIIHANPAIAHIYGYDSPEEFMNSTDDVGRYYLNPSCRQDFKNILEEKGVVDNFEAQICRKTGETVWISINARAVGHEDGTIRYYEGTVQDVTDRKHLLSQLLQSQKMEAVGQLAGGIAHDFNNILTALIGYGSLLKMKIERSNPVSPYVDQILASSQTAANLTKSLLVFSRKEAMELRVHKVGPLIESVEKLLRRLLTEDIECRIILDRKDVPVMADMTQLHQVFINLATNARDAMPTGGTLSIETNAVYIDSEFIEVRGYGKPGQYALISFTDTGSGMDRQTLEKIFDPFFTTKEVGKGTGLGLSIAYGIIKQHRGYITVDSEPGKGTTIRLYLPATKEHAEETEDSARNIRGGTETILIAEDNAGLRGLIVEILTGRGYRVIETSDGEDAIRRFREHAGTISLLILDVVMPRKNGRQAYEEIHELQPGIKVLFTSGYTRDVVIDKGLYGGEFHFIQKPLSPNELLLRVRDILDA